MGIKVTNIALAMEMLSFLSIKAEERNNTILVSEDNYKLVEDLLQVLGLIPASPQPKEKAPRKSQGARPTLASKGLRAKVRLSVTINAEADDWLWESIRDSELISHTLSRIIMEHKTMTELREFE